MMGNISRGLLILLLIGAVVSHRYGVPPIGTHIEYQSSIVQTK